MLHQPNIQQKASAHLPKNNSPAATDRNPYSPTKEEASKTQTNTARWQESPNASATGRQYCISKEICISRSKRQLLNQDAANIQPMSIIT
ncbi:hypothetical protein Nepgr_005254 [Nepenthes gracilis]|uniref:Uncharacterized protein n=1 Tax=Nepenthes gracilis TaxID=150966 RepID=A0AAD3S2U0_NEPGR|nr:hypothetical protein Nepgr_005254 [Nepenthes gracilis]